MTWLELTKKTRIVLTHRYFDFSHTRWEKHLAHGTLDPFLHKNLVTPRPNIKIPESWQEALSSLPEKLQALAYFEKDYPEQLLALDAKCPPVVYIRGNENIPHPSSLVAIVGTRNPSYLGRKNAEHFSHSVAAKGIGVVSGLARGIDSIAHRCALHPYTIAVLGGGVNTIYPKEHADLAEEIIAKGGTLLSQFPDTQIIQPSNFPRRNLLIAALAAGTIVIEGSEKSGAHLTGRLTLSIGKHAIALLQDFSSAAGKGAISLLDSGGSYARDPNHALQIIAGRWPQGLVSITSESGAAVPPPSEFTLDEWVDRYGDTTKALRELEIRIHEGTIAPIGGGIYKNNA